MKVPAIVRQMSKDAYKATGIIPCVTYVDNTWTVSVSNDRVEAQGMFTSDKGYWKSMPGKLTIDGIVCESADSYERLTEIFADPDSHLGKDFIPENEFKPLDMARVEKDFTEAPAAEAPAMAQSFYKMISKEESLTVKIGRTSLGWAVIVIVINPDEIQAIRLDVNGTKMYPTVFFDGGEEKISANDMQKLVAMMLGPGKTPEAQHSMGSPSNAAKVNSVDVRQGTVRRV